MQHHHLDDQTVHHQWDSSLVPRLVVDSGDSITFTCRDASDGHYHPSRTPEEIARPRQAKGHPLTGPVYVRGAEPGDSLAIEVVSFQHKGYGWTVSATKGDLLPGEAPCSR